MRYLDRSKLEFSKLHLELLNDNLTANSECDMFDPLKQKS